MSEPKRERDWTDTERRDIEASRQRGCEACRRPVPEGEPVRVRNGLIGNRLGLVVCCEPCYQRQQKEIAEVEQRRRAEEEARGRSRRLRCFEKSFADSCVGAAIVNQALADRALGLVWEEDWDATNEILSEYWHKRVSGPLRFPKWAWNRFENAEFRRRVSPLIWGSLDNYSPEDNGSMVIVGKTGIGKSSVPAAWVWRRHDELRRRVEAGEDLSFNFAWVSGYELAGCRKRSQLGDEAALVLHASRVPLLILDEVGHEPTSEEIMTVIDARYRAELPTVLTSPLEWKALAQHIGGGAYRRLLENGRLVDGHAEKTRVRAV